MKPLKFGMLICMLVLVQGCNDPYDPIIGPRNPRQGAEHYLEKRNDIDEFEKHRLLNYQPCSPVTLRLLSTAKSREVRSLVAGNYGTPLDVLQLLANDSEPGVRQAVATNPNISRELLIKLKGDPDYNVRWIVPVNKNWLPEDLRQMYEEKFANKNLLARNPSTPQDILLKFAKSHDPIIQLDLAINPSITDDIAREILNANANEGIKRTLASNPAISDQILIELTNDDNPNVRRFAGQFLQKRLKRK